MPFLSRMPLPALIAAFLFATLFLSACGGDSAKSVDAEDWVADVCDRFIEFDEDGEEIAGEFFDIDFDDPEEAKDGVLAFLADSRKAFNSLEADFKKLGQPDVDGGSSVKEAFIANFQSVQKDHDRAVKEIRALDTDTGDFEADVMDVFDKIEDENFRDVLEKLAEKKDGVEEIIDLIDEDPDCAAVIFSDDEDSAADDGKDPSPTKKAGSAATPVKTSTAVARTTPKANATRNEKFVIGLCVALTDWMDDATVLVDSLTLPSDASAKQMKDEMVAYFQKALDLTTTLRKALTALPVPDGKDGKAIHQAFAQMGTDIEKSFADILTKIKAMDTKSVTQVQADIEKFSDEFDLLMDEAGSEAEEIDVKYDTEDISRIAENVPECEGIL